MREIIENILEKYNGLYFIGKENMYTYHIFPSQHVFNPDVILDIEKAFHNKWYVTSSWTLWNDQYSKTTSIVIRK